MNSNKEGWRADDLSEVPGLSFAGRGAVRYEFAARAHAVGQEAVNSREPRNHATRERARGRWPVASTAR